MNGTRHSHSMKLISSIQYLVLLIPLTTTTGQSLAKTDSGQQNEIKNIAENCPHKQYIFSWNLTDTCLPQPRGGTSKGAPVTLATTPSPRWLALQEPGLSKFEQDRRAILAMTGGYRASFEFLETIGYPADYELARPYQSWGTEYIYLVEDRGEFISLQHIMVMFFQQEEGKLSDPMVMKHWRQDWQYQDREILQYSGNNTWKNHKLSKKEVKGTWSQSVYQVDDSPRYASFGSWQHNASFSAWESGDTWRPLPRREHSVREDYQEMEGINRHIILPTGWVQEEENFKRLSSGTESTSPNYVAKELGNNRYQLLTDFDWSAGDQYWKVTGPFWKIVRQQWEQVSKRKTPLALKKQHEGTPLFMALFQLAEQFGNGELDDPEKAVANALHHYVQ